MTYVRVCLLSPMTISRVFLSADTYVALKCIRYILPPSFVYGLLPASYPPRLVDLSAFSFGLVNGRPAASPWQPALSGHRLTRISLSRSERPQFVILAESDLGADK
jgi:hypothetical protein